MTGSADAPGPPTGSPSRVPGGGWVDHGGQWIGPGQTQIPELAKEVGVETFPTFQDGQYLLVFGGQRLVYSTDDPTRLDLPVPEADNQELLQVLAEIDTLSRTVPPHAPWEAPRAKEWDTQTADTWIEQNLATDGAKFALHAAIVGYFSVEPSDLSFLHLLFYMSVGAASSRSRRVRWPGGSKRVPKRSRTDWPNAWATRSATAARSGKSIRPATKWSSALTRAVSKPVGSSLLSLPSWLRGSNTSRPCRPHVTST